MDANGDRVSAWTCGDILVEEWVVHEAVYMISESRERE